MDNGQAGRKRSAAAGKAARSRVPLESHREFEPVPGREPGGVDVAEGAASRRQLGGVGGGPEALETSSTDDQSGRRADRVLDGLRRLDGLLETAFVVVGTGRGQRVGRDRGGRLGRRRSRDHEQGEDRSREAPENRIRHSLI